MKLYKLKQLSPDPTQGVVRVRWEGTQAAAASTRKVWVSTYGAKRDDILTFEVDVPTDKKGLLEFLNTPDTPLNAGGQ